MSDSTKELFRDKAIATFDSIKSELKSIFYKRARLVTETKE